MASFLLSISDSPWARFLGPRTRPLLFFFLLPILLGLPFVGRAYFVDDHYHLLMARGTLEHPLRPYDFRADDDGVGNAGWERGQPPRMVNPPLHHYLLGLFWEIGGGRLWVVRLLSLLLAGGAAVFIYLLAGRLLLPPGPVTWLSVVTPTFWLSSYALLIDSTLLFFFLGALWTWIEGLRRRSGLWSAVSGVLMGLTVLTKYTGAMIGPVALLYWWFDRESGRRLRPWLAFLIPCALFAAWSGWNVATYGAVHLTESSKRVMQSFSLGHVLVFLTFLSGVFLYPLAGWFSLRDRRGRLLAFFAMALLAFFLAGPSGGFSRFQALTMALLAVGGGLFLWAVGRGLARSRFPFDAFLAAWLLLGAVQTVYVMQWVAARYFLTVLVPVVFLTYRLWQGASAFSPMGLNRRHIAAGGAVFLFSLALAVGDFKQAETSRSILRDVTRDGLLSSGRTGFFLEDSFKSSYLKAGGWRPAFSNTPLEPGNLILHQEIIMPPWWFRAEKHPRRPLRVYEYPSRWPLRVMDNQGSAGWYASAWGALPFTLTRGPLERYTLYEVLPNEAPSLPPAKGPPSQNAVVP